jgi:hypothetical protein
MAEARVGAVKRIVKVVLGAILGVALVGSLVALLAPVSRMACLHSAESACGDGAVAEAKYTGNALWGSCEVLCKTGGGTTETTGTGQ